MLYKSTAFTAVSLLLFFFSILFASGAMSRHDISRNASRKLATLLAVDTLAIVLLLASRTASGINDQNTVITMTAAGFSNGIYAVSMATKTRHFVKVDAPSVVSQQKGTQDLMDYSSLEPAFDKSNFQMKF